MRQMHYVAKFVVLQPYENNRACELFSFNDLRPVLLMVGPSCC